MRKGIVIMTGGIAFSAVLGTIGAAPSGAGPTCSDIGALETHGQHIVGDYVTGVGGIDGTLDWPPQGGIGSIIGGEGAAHPGRSGIHSHGGFAPGASFCADSASPGVHLNP